MHATFGSRVADHYDADTQAFYLDRWHPEDIHFGYFPAGSDPRDRHAAVKAMTWAVVEPAGLRATDIVVDAGCGVGGTAIDIARPLGVRVTGLTISPIQVEIGTRRALAERLSHRVSFCVADCSRELPFEDDSVDVVVTIEAARHFEDKRPFLRECRRVLKPGGRLAGSDWMCREGSVGADYGQLLDFVCDAWHVAGLERPSAWHRMLAEAGFEIRELEDFGDSVMPNARILSRARLDLLREMADETQSGERAERWHARYDTLARAWTARHFTIGRFLAVNPM